METIKVGDRKFRNDEIEMYKLEYGIDLHQCGDKILLTGGLEEVNIISARIRKEIFLENNSCNYQESNDDSNDENKNSISNLIENIEYKTDYSKFLNY